MADKKKSGETEKSEGTEDAGQAEVQAAVDEEQEQGFRGERTDPTPDFNYTLAGVTSGAPTPETDAQSALEADQYSAKLATKFGTDKYGNQVSKDTK